MIPANDSAIVEARPVELEVDEPESRPRMRRPPWSRRAAALAAPIASGFGIGLLALTSLCSDSVDVEALVSLHLPLLIKAVDTSDR